MTQNNLQIDSAAVSDKGLSEKRPQNEDSYLELRDCSLYAVADGVGGAQAGDVASQMAVEILGEGFINLQEDGDAEERMKVAIEQANSAIYQMSNELAQLSTMATTVVAVHINGNIATIGHVGDSRLYRLDQEGNLFRETQDHSVVEEEVRAGRMTPEQALTHPSRNVISRALGAEPTVEIDMKTIMFEPNTKFLVCSDGVTRHIPDEELRSLLMEENDSYITCNTIKELCYERGAEDNLTAVIVSITEAESDAAINSSQEPVLDFEEDTIATARPPLVNSGVLASSNVDSEEIPTHELSTPFAQNEQTEQTTGKVLDDEIVIPTRQDDSKDAITISTQAQQQNLKNETVAEKDIKSYKVDDKGGIGIVSTIISGVLWLLIGALIGALGYYYWSTTNKGETTVPIQPQNIGMTTSVYDESKRLAITNPKRFIADNVEPKTALESYLLALAFIQDGNSDGAKKELEKAQNNLNSVPEQDREVLKHDISLAMTKVNSGDDSKDSANTTSEEDPKSEVEPKVVKSNPEASLEPAAVNDE